MNGMTGASPWQLLLGRAPRTMLDLLHPDSLQRVRVKQQYDYIRLDSSAKTRDFAVGKAFFFETTFVATAGRLV